MFLQNNAKTVVSTLNSNFTIIKFSIVSTIFSLKLVFLAAQFSPAFSTSQNCSLTIIIP